MQARSISPFKRLTRSKPADPAGNLKVGFFFLFVGFSSHILFFESLVMLLKLEETYISILSMLEVTGLPEIDILTPLIIISIFPILIAFSNPALFLISEIPWIFAGFLTGIVFGPKYDRVIVYSPIIFITTCFFLFFILFYSLFGLGTSAPINIILFYYISLIILIIGGFLLLIIISLLQIIPALIGYTFGKKNFIFSVSPQIFLAQPDRQDPTYTRCKYLTVENHCSIANRTGVYLQNFCNNKWNHQTCSFYLQLKNKEVSKRKQPGDYIDEI